MTCVCTEVNKEWNYIRIFCFVRSIVQSAVAVSGHIQSSIMEGYDNTETPGYYSILATECHQVSASDTAHLMPSYYCCFVYS